MEKEKKVSEADRLAMILRLDGYCCKRDCYGCPVRLDPALVSENGYCLSFNHRTDEQVREAYRKAFGNFEHESAEKVATATIKPVENESEPRTEREELLREAIRCVTGHRVDEHGKPEDNFKKIAKLWQAYNGHEYTAHDVAMMMALLKVARIRTGHGGKDSYIDLAGYAACAGEMAQKYNQ